MAQILRKGTVLSSLEQTAAVLYGEQKYPQALDIYLSLYRKNPKTEKYSIYCGSCFDALGKPAQAIKFYQKASKLNPSLFKFGQYCLLPRDF